MNKLYINLHPEHDYATVFMAGTCIMLKGYINSVEWLAWPNQPKGYITVSALSKDAEAKKIEHIDKAYILAQRLQKFGAEVVVRNGRKDQWEPFVSREYSEEFMYKTECENPDFELEVKSIMEDMAKYGELEKLDGTEKEELTELMGKLVKIMKKEKRRKEYIHNLWNN